MTPRRYPAGSHVYVIELKHPRAWRLACGVTGTATSWLSLRDAVVYRRLVEARGIECRIVRYAAAGVVSFRRKWERRARKKGARK